MKHLLKRLKSGTQCTVCLQTWKTKPRKNNCLGLPEELAKPSHLVFRKDFRQYNRKPAGRAIACYIEYWKRIPSPYIGKVATYQRKNSRQYYLGSLLYDFRDWEIDDPNFPPILDWRCRPKDLYTSYKLEKWNLKPGKAKPKAAIWHWTNQDWVFFYDKADCEIDDPNLPPCYDFDEVPEGLDTKQHWKKVRPNEVIPSDTKPRGCYRYYSTKYEEWITQYLYSEADLVWQPKDNLISKSVLKSRYLLSEGWIKRLGDPDVETLHSKYKSPVYLYSRHRVERFLADNAEEYAEWLTKRDRYIDIFNDNKEKILVALAKATETRKAQAKKKRQLKKAQPIADKFNWDKEENIVKQQMILCLTCNCSSTYIGNKGLDFLCSVHPTGIAIEQMLCKDWEEKC